MKKNMLQSVIPILIFIWILGGMGGLNAQSEVIDVKVTLDGYIDMALKGSAKYKMIDLDWQRTIQEASKVRLSTKPSLLVSSTVPNFVRAVDAVTQPDGTDLFINRSLMNTTLDLSMKKTFLQTGGTLSVGMGINRLDIFRTNTIEPSNTYAFSALEIGYNQSLFQFNELKWELKIAELRSMEASSRRKEVSAEIEYEAIELFLNLYEKQLQIESIIQDMLTFSRLIANTEAKLKLGSVKRLDYIQLKIDRNNLRGDSLRVRQELQNIYNLMNNLLQTQLNYRWTAIWEKQVLPDLLIDIQSVRERVTQHPSLSAEAQVNHARADRDLEKASRESGVEVNLQVNFGVNQISSEFSDIWNGRYLDQERLLVELRVPIIDWGKRRSNMELAKQNIEYERSRYELEKNELQRQVIEIMKEYTINKERYEQLQVDITLFREKYEVSLQQFALGEISAQLLSIALNDFQQIQLEKTQAFLQAYRYFYKINQLLLLR